MRVNVSNTVILSATVIANAAVILSAAKDLSAWRGILQALRSFRMTGACVLAAAALAACSTNDRAPKPPTDSTPVVAPAPASAVPAVDTARIDSVALAIAAAAPKPAAKDDDPPYHGPSTLDGLYTDEQADRGRDVYFGNCRSCHSPQSHTGATFATWWRGKQLSDLYTFVAQRMPKNDPGSLAPEDVADVVAYLLKMNALPTGPVELYPDADSLKQYRIETKRRRSSSTATRTQP